MQLEGKNVRIEFPDMEKLVLPEYGQSNYTFRAPVPKNKMRRLLHRFQMQKVCAELGRENYPSRQVMRRVALSILKDARRDHGRTTNGLRERMDKNGKWMRFGRELLTGDTSKALNDLMKEMHDKLPKDRDLNIVAAPEVIGAIMGEPKAGKNISVMEFTMKDRPDLGVMTVKEILEFGRKVGAKVTTKMTKNDLIDAIDNHLTD